MRTAATPERPCKPARLRPRLTCPRSRQLRMLHPVADLRLVHFRGPSSEQEPEPLRLHSPFPHFSDLIRPDWQCGGHGFESRQLHRQAKPKGLNPAQLPGTRPATRFVVRCTTSSTLRPATSIVGVRFWGLTPSADSSLGIDRSSVDMSSSSSTSVLAIAAGHPKTCALRSSTHVSSSSIRSAMPSPSRAPRTVIAATEGHPGGTG